VIRAKLQEVFRYLQQMYKIIAVLLVPWKCCLSILQARPSHAPPAMLQ